jgi:hypothetical protein
MFRVRRGSKLLDRERLLPEKRIQAPDTRRGEIKILDSCSISQVHLWSKSQILRMLAKAERLAERQPGSSLCRSPGAARSFCGEL